MKKTLLAVITATLLLNSALAEEHHHSKPSIKEENDHPKTPLTLNHGKKWPVDRIMKENMGAIHQKFKILSAPSKKLSNNNARELSAIITTSAQNIINNCKMEPEQDQAFHSILADLFAVAADLKEIEKNELALKKLTQTLKSYSEYFDHSLAM